jgi:hypothetical protein
LQVRRCDKAKYMGMSGDQDAEQSRSVRLIIVPFKGGRILIFGNNFNKSKLCSGIN